VTIGSGVFEGAGVEFPTFPLTCVVVLKTLWHYRASVWWNNLCKCKREENWCIYCYCSEGFSLKFINIYTLFMKRCLFTKTL